MAVIEIEMYKRKSTDYKVKFKDSRNRLGNIYLEIPMAEKMCLDGKITVQVAPEKGQLKQNDTDYVTLIVRKKEQNEKIKKVKYIEDTREPGALGVVYVSKEFLMEMGWNPYNPIALRIIGQNGAGGEALAEPGQ
jgi:hypothetical protein